MNIRLKPDAEAYLAAEVASGRYASLEEAVDALARDDQAARAALDATDLAWARPFVDRGLADLAAKRTRSSDDVHAELRSRYRADPEG